MIIQFSYNKRNISFVEGYIFKGAFYRCNYTRFHTLYKNPAPGTETVEIYNFEPKADIKASVIIIPGLGSGSVPFLLWMGTHLASAGVHSTIVVLPGNYTRVEQGSVSGRSYLWPDLSVMYRFWEHAVVDILSIIDLLQQKKVWRENNLLLGYCLGGMLSTIVTALDKRVNQTVLMTTGGNIPRIFHESLATLFARKLFDKGFKSQYDLHDKKKLYSIYEEQLDNVRKMSFLELTRSKDIHPLFRLDPISYAHLLDKNKVTMIDALIDETLPLMSRLSLYKELRGATRYVLPMTHVSWLPFERFFAEYVLMKVNINDKKLLKTVLKKQKEENNFLEYIINKARFK